MVVNESKNEGVTLRGSMRDRSSGYDITVNGSESTYVDLNVQPTVEKFFNGLLTIAKRHFSGVSSEAAELGLAPQVWS